VKVSASLDLNDNQRSLLVLIGDELLPPRHRLAERSRDRKLTASMTSSSAAAAAAGVMDDAAVTQTDDVTSNDVTQRQGYNERQLMSDEVTGAPVCLSLQPQLASPSVQLHTSCILCTFSFFVCVHNKYMKYITTD